MNILVNKLLNKIFGRVFKLVISMLNAFDWKHTFSYIDSLYVLFLVYLKLIDFLRAFLRCRKYSAATVFKTGDLYYYKLKFVRTT